MSDPKFAIAGDLLAVDVTRLTRAQLAPWRDRTWRVSIKFEDGAFVLEGVDGSFLVHDLTGLRHADGAAIRPAFDTHGCARNDCERNSVGLCGRFGE